MILDWASTLGHWVLIAVLLTGFIWAAASLMGMTEGPRWAKGVAIAAVIVIGMPHHLERLSLRLSAFAARVTCAPLVPTKLAAAHRVIGKAMPETVGHLLERAVQCEQKAAWTKDEAQRHTFLELAKAWREMATDYEELTQSGETLSRSVTPETE